MTRVRDDGADQLSNMVDLKSLSFQERLAIGLMRLKAQRRLTNKDLAEQLGVSEAYMSQVTRGMRDVKLSTLDKMQREWNVTIEDLFRVSDSDLARIAAWRARRRKKKATDEPT
ncbi:MULTISPECIES: helix-turn-helix transcriptional regulator [Rhizobium]|jgi:DNA-binding Xre family transcriptional regulator|uniref:helix-turn-helix domain-containing protein n=1 Tax=Rhizobium TaxID=379 RepID=UPI00064909A8|nr:MULTISPECIES: helix-turn-helix transcriptional regulator [Rhizobium]OWK24873.1 XRE family transcriptional regulator [Rhizobium yanglingense]MBY5827771.1 helix-turn-helix transcriptional regulator [Rhizobium leguminosarum]NKJ08468.1 DNA-binding Xre family transcriptional regulator [Rhizobium sp. SG741]OCJ08259.1 XRE family transcriptional regulator [Rhizobium sp. AC27/96]RKD50482.1 DNA-binding Xre family transcriptional regulator [Rhizobium sp. WW_1]